MPGQLQCQGNYRSSVAYQETITPIRMFQFSKDALGVTIDTDNVLICLLSLISYYSSFISIISIMYFDCIYLLK